MECCICKLLDVRFQRHEDAVVRVSDNNVELLDKGVLRALGRKS